VSLFEPVHGSAPKYAGKNITNPIGAILSAGLMLDYIGYPEAAKGVENAVIQTIAEKQVTRDLGGSLTTTAAGDTICAAIK
jgi:isocitrate/isopropylmalate dehydrogenase